MITRTYTKSTDMMSAPLKAVVVFMAPHTPIEAGWDISGR
jgi:hypothetical protein